MYQVQGKYEEALVELKKGLEVLVATDVAATRSNIGSVYGKTGKKREAKTLFTEAGDGGSAPGLVQCRGKRRSGTELGVCLMQSLGAVGVGARREGNVLKDTFCLGNSPCLVNSIVCGAAAIRGTVRGTTRGTTRGTVLEGGARKE